MHGRFFGWLAWALLATTAGTGWAMAEQFGVGNLPPDPAYMAANPLGGSRLISNSMTLSDIAARLERVEATLADQKKEEQVQWEDVSGQKWKGKIGGRIMGDYVMFSHQDAANLAAFGDQQNYFEFRRIRLFASGSGYGVYDYKLQLEFEPERGGVAPVNLAPAVAIKDLYVGIHDIPLLGYVRFGHYKAPFSLEKLTSSKYNTFMERALSNIFAPFRSVGVTAYNHTANDRFTWGYGAFFEGVSPTAHERIGDAQGVRVAVRGVWTPVYTANGRGLLHIGGGWQYVDDRDDSVRFRARPEVHEGSRFIDSGTIAARDYNVLNLELASIYGPFSLQSELFYTEINSIAGPQVDLYGAYAYASYFLTGESRAYKRHAAYFGRVKPHTNFWVVRTSDGPSAGWGAWELAARWS